MQNEKEIVEHCCKGRREAQKALYDHFAPKMLALCFRYCDSLEEAEDVLQEGFIKVFRYIGTFQGKSPIESWIRKIMVNTALNYLKKIADYRFHDDLDELPESLQPESGTVNTLEVKEMIEMIRTLPPGYRTVFNLFEIEGFNHKEIASMLGVSVNTSKSQLLKAKRMLQDKLRKIEKT
ncbi:MAG: RNA polymerase sigma factor [Bacteroidales bacterium]